MVLGIESEMTVEQLQRKFSSCFPFLKIELTDKRFSHPYRSMRPAHPVFVFPFLVDLLNNKQNSQRIEITRQMTVDEVKETLQLAYRVDVRIFRRSGNVWVETSLTNNWTLEEQNRQGACITSQLKYW